MTAGDSGGGAPRVAGPSDLRLAGGALAAWLTTLALLGQRPAVCYLTGLSGLVGGGICLCRRGRWLPGAALVVGCVGAAGLAAGMRAAAAEACPLTGLARSYASATVDVTIRDDPRPLEAAAGGGPERVVIQARADRVLTGTHTWRVSASVVVLAPAAGWRGLLPSQHVRVAARLTPSRRNDFTVAVLSARGAPVAVGPASAPQRYAAALRAGLRDSAAGLPDGPRGLLPGLVVGDVSGLDPLLADDFRAAGLSHLVAVSGANLQITAGTVLFVLRRATVGPRASAVVAGLVLVGFVVLARPSASVLRAAVMGGIGLLSLVSGRQRDAAPALGASVLALVLAVPSLARDTGFTLSVLATAGLVLLAPSWAAGMRRWLPAGLAEAVAVPAAAAAVTAPVIAAVSGQLSLVTVPANMLAAPAVAPATVIGLLIVLVAPVYPAAAALLAHVAGVPVSWLVWVAEHAANVPFGVVNWPAGRRGAAGLAAVIVLSAFLLRSRRIRRAAIGGLLGAALAVAAIRIVVPGWPPPGWLLVACDVGQGAALAIRTGPHEAIVVDAGPEPLAVDHCLRRLRITRVPLLVLTHFHLDHVGGIEGVFRRRAVGALETGALRDPVQGWQLVRRVAAKHGLPLEQAKVGQRQVVAAVTIDVLGPRATFTGTRSDPNNSSLVLRVSSAHHILLLAADAEVEAQEAMVRTGVDLRADVLKVAHHGSAWQAPAFVAAAHASVGLVSVGADNDYGLPSRQFLDEASRLGTTLVRTDLNGDIAVCARGGQLTVVTRRGRPPGPAP